MFSNNHTKFELSWAGTCQAKAAFIKALLCVLHRHEVKEYRYHHRHEVKEYRYHHRKSERPHFDTSSKHTWLKTQTAKTKQKGLRLKHTVKKLARTHIAQNTHGEKRRKNSQNHRWLKTHKAKNTPWLKTYIAKNTHMAKNTQLKTHHG